MDNFENTQQVENTQLVDNPITINNEIKDYLVETSRWGKFLAILGYIGMGFLVLAGLFVMIGFSAFSSISDIDFPMGLLGFIYILVAVLYYFPVTYLYKYSVQIQKGCNSNDQESVASGFENLKSLFKFLGIFTIVILSIYVLILIVVIPVTIFSSL